jgi:hypothetical protein
VRQELRLTPESAQRIVELLRRASLLQGRTVEDGLARQNRMQQIAKRYLSESQRKRLAEIAVQAYGPKLFRSSAFAQDLGLTAEQIQTYTARVSNITRRQQLELYRQASQRRPAENSFAGNLQNRENMAWAYEAQAEREREIARIGREMLTPEQRTRYGVMQGKPFTSVRYIEGLQNY